MRTNTPVRWFEDLIASFKFIPDESISWDDACGFAHLHFLQAPRVSLNNSVTNHPDCNPVLFTSTLLCLSVYMLPPPTWMRWIVLFVSVGSVTALQAGPPQSFIGLNAARTAAPQRTAEPTASAVLRVIQEAATDPFATRDLAPRQDDAVHDKQCCRVGSVQGVLDEAMLFQKAAQAGPQPMNDAPRLLRTLRSELAQPWEDALRAVIPAKINTSSSCQCRSVEVVEANPSVSGSRTALLLVVDSASFLQKTLQAYSLSLLMMWSYARMHGYGLHIYIHGAKLPEWDPVYFVKPAGILHLFQDLSYEHVLQVDWDIYLSPHTAPPLSTFFDEFPAAGMMMQGETNLVAGASLWRNNQAGITLLRAWWDMGARGCCPTEWHDQTALRHLVRGCIANVTGDVSVYSPEDQQHLKFPATLPPPLARGAKPKDTSLREVKDKFAVQSDQPPDVPAWKWLQLRPVLVEEQSPVGLVGLDAHHHRWVGVRGSQLAGHSRERAHVCLCISVWLNNCFVG